MACGDDHDGDGGKGGGAGSSSGSSGTNATGGTGATGGTSAAGGTSGSESGGAAVGGKAGDDGGSSSGGAAGSAGVAGEAGLGGAGGDDTGGSSGTAGSDGGGAAGATAGTGGAGAAGATAGSGGMAGAGGATAGSGGMAGCGAGGATAGTGGTAGGGSGGATAGTGGAGGGEGCPRGYSGTPRNCVPNTCDGAPDPDCACLFVSPDGNDELAAASGGYLPFRNVQPAIDFADAHRSGPDKVCVAQGATCDSSASYPGPAGADLGMRDGISVYGDYETTTFSRCSSRGTILEPGSAAGVYFGPSVVNATVLDRFVIERFSAATSTGITLDGASGVIVSDLEIGAAPGATTAVGVDAKNGANATLVRVAMPLVQIDGAYYSAPNQIGFRAIGSRLAVADSNVAFMGAFGQTQTFQGVWVEGSPDSSIERTAIRIWSGPQGTASGIHVSDSPGFVLDGSSIALLDDLDRAELARGAEFVRVPDLSWSGGALEIEGRNIAHGIFADDCPNALIDVSTRLVAQTPLAVGIELRGDSDGSELGGSLAIPTSAAGRGVAVEDCEGGALSIETQISASTAPSASFAAIRVSGDCLPTISSSVTITKGTTNQAQALTGIHCIGRSRCAVEASTVRILGSNTLPGAAITATGILCDAGSCSSITNSAISGLSQAGELRNSRYTGGGVVAPGAVLVSRNRIDAGCSGGGGVGLAASGRIENNVIRGPSCGGSFLDGIAVATGLAISGGADVHSNTIFGGGALDGVPFGQLGCRSSGIVLGGGDTSIRNSIVSATVCNERRAIVREPGATAPGALEHNDLSSAVLYLDGATPLTSIPSVNALAGASGNFDANPLLDSSARLTSGSPCIDAGATAGAPAIDLDGDARDQSPDVGSDEWTGAAR